MAQDHWLTSNQAISRVKAKGFRCTRTSFLSWTIKHRLGKKIGGRWYIDQARLDQFLTGKLIGDDKR